MSTKKQAEVIKLRKESAALTEVDNTEYVSPARAHRRVVWTALLFIVLFSVAGPLALWLK